MNYIFTLRSHEKNKHFLFFALHKIPNFKTLASWKWQYFTRTTFLTSLWKQIVFSMKLECVNFHFLYLYASHCFYDFQTWNFRPSPNHDPRPRLSWPSGHSSIVKRVIFFIIFTLFPTYQIVFDGQYWKVRYTVKNFWR